MKWKIFQGKKLSNKELLSYIVIASFVCLVYCLNSVLGEVLFWLSIFILACLGTAKAPSGGDPYNGRFSGKVNEPSEAE